jgi:Trypsin-like peptidase domain
MKPSPRTRLARRAIVAAALLAGATPAVVNARADRDSAHSVVKVTCKLPDGKQMDATGFVWHSPTQVVTALHAAVGCNSLLVWSEATTTETTATLDKASLEADLALLSLAHGLGVPPIDYAPDEPDTDAQYFVWGYPHGVPQMRNAKVSMSGGLSGGVTTLDQAYGGEKELTAMLAGQNFPRADTSVLAIPTLLQPGQSGAPIFDNEGRVVAIADGGLLGGWRGLNWGIPAYLYLPGLPNSGDDKPTGASKWAIQYSAVTVAPEAPVAMPADSAGASQLRRVRHVTLDQLEQQMLAAGEDTVNVDFIRGKVTPEEFAKLAFDIYEDPNTGASLGVAAGMSLKWNGQELEAAIPSGVARMFVAVMTAASHPQARREAKAFADSLVHLASWERSPASLADFHSDPAFEWANGANFFDGVDAVTGLPTDLNLSLTVSGPRFLGYGLYGPAKIEKLPTADLVAYLMMQFAAQELSDLAQEP